MRRPLLPALVACVSFSALPGAPRAIPWPGTQGPQGPRADPLDPLRWRRLPRWTAPGDPRLRRPVAPVSTPRPEAEARLREVLVARLEDRPDALREALARLGEGAVLLDVDATLSAAWEAAQRQAWGDASRLLRAALPRLGPEVPRELLVLDGARWSMARGPEGLDDALALLGAWVPLAPSPRSALARATLVLGLLRAGRADEARALAASVAPLFSAQELSRGPNPVAAGTALMMDSEVDAALGVTLSLASRHADALPLLRRAAEGAPPAWRSFQTAFLARAPAAGSPPARRP
ncbi:MAG: hypothetical protein HY909_27365 [Deltaproteobacteria bacterium]|nr:hypothetical protein [Deltaproteobacteria bacterium]